MTETESESELRHHARRYLEALERGVQGTDLAAFFTEDAVQEEFPNRLLDRGASRDVGAMVAGQAAGADVLRSQRYEVLSMLVGGHRVVLEVAWHGVLDRTLGTLAPGQTMRARLAIFLDYRDGRIARQRNYDCFDPW